MQVAGWVAYSLLVIVGGYAFSAAASSALALGLPRLVGMARSEAVVLSALLGFLIYLGALLWGFTARAPVRVGLVFGAGITGWYGLLHWLAPEWLVALGLSLASGA
jgi:hypothetical protein